MTPARREPRLGPGGAPAPRPAGRPPARPACARRWPGRAGHALLRGGLRPRRHGPGRRPLARRPAPAARSPPRTTSAPTTRSACWPCPRAEIARIHGSSGTTGKPTFVAYTPRRPADLVGAVRPLPGGRRAAARAPRAHRLRLRPLHRRLRPPLRASSRSAPASCRRPAATLPARSCCCSDLRPDVLVCTPSYALHIAEVARAAGCDPRDLGLCLRPLRRRALDRGDARARSSASSGIQAFNNYGLTEVIGPGV